MAQARLHQLHLFQLHLSGAKIKSILVPLKRETIMIRFILLWDQKWEANSIVSAYMHDEASKLIFNRDWDWEYHRLWSSQKQAQCWKEESITQPLESKQSFAEKIQNRKIIQLAQVQDSRCCNFHLLQTLLASVLTIFLISGPNWKAWYLAPKPQTRDIGK